MRALSLHSRLAAVAALVAVCVLSNSCHKGPTDPSDNVIDTFTGTVTKGVGNSAIHTFNVSNNGELFATLVSLTPSLPSSKYAAFWLGTSGSGGCVWDGPQTSLGQPGTVLTNSVREGAFCVAVIDRGDFPTDEAYVVKVSHP